MSKPDPVTHDYTKRYWGHDYTFDPIDDGQRGYMMGWGSGIKPGHFLIIQNGSDSTRYSVDTIRYSMDPSDMWSAEVSFAPRMRDPRPEQNRPALPPPNAVVTSQAPDHVRTADSGSEGQESASGAPERPNL